MDESNQKPEACDVLLPEKPVEEARPTYCGKSTVKSVPVVFGAGGHLDINALLRGSKPCVLHTGHSNPCASTSHCALVGAGFCGASGQPCLGGDCRNSATPLPADVFQIQRKPMCAACAQRVEGVKQYWEHSLDEAKKSEALKHGWRAYDDYASYRGHDYQVYNNADRSRLMLRGLCSEDCSELAKVALESFCK